jgi:hypothetical protein
VALKEDLPAMKDTAGSSGSLFIQEPSWVDLLCLYLSALLVSIPLHLAKENRVVAVCRTRHIQVLIVQAGITSVTYAPQLLLAVKVAGLGKLARVALNSIDPLRVNTE